MIFTLRTLVFLFTLGWGLSLPVYSAYGYHVGVIAIVPLAILSLITLSLYLDSGVPFSGEPR